MNKITGTGVEQIDRYDYLKRQYCRQLEIWQERADQEYQLCCEKQGRESNKKCRGLLHIIAKFKMDAYEAGISGEGFPGVAEAIGDMAEHCSDDPMGRAFFETIEETIIESYRQGQEARR